VVGGTAQERRVVAFVGWSGSGKTTLIERLIPLLRETGLVVGYLKSTHHGFEMDREGKDSDRMFRAGAEPVVVVSPDEGAVRFPVRERRDPRALVAKYAPACDLVLVEGFKGSDLPKIEVAKGEPLLDGDDPTLLALVADEEDPRPVPRFARLEVDALARFVADLAVGRMSRAR